jgi:hypothetical protein
MLASKESARKTLEEMEETAWELMEDAGSISPFLTI